MTLIFVNTVWFPRFLTVHARFEVFPLTWWNQKWKGWLWKWPLWKWTWQLVHAIFDESESDNCESESDHCESESGNWFMLCLMKVKLTIMKVKMTVVKVKVTIDSWLYMPGLRSFRLPDESERERDYNESESGNWFLTIHVFFEVFPLTWFIIWILIMISIHYYWSSIQYMGLFTNNVSSIYNWFDYTVIMKLKIIDHCNYLYWDVGSYPNNPGFYTLQKVWARQRPDFDNTISER